MNQNLPSINRHPPSILLACNFYVEEKLDMEKTDDTSQNNTTPIKHKVDVQNSNDIKINEDFNGFPDGPAKESTINPKTPTEKKTAQVDETPVKNTSGPSH